MRRLFCLFAMLLAAGCADTSIIPFAGYWTGEFKARPSDSKQKMRPEWVYKGYIQLYATGRKFKMHMESIAQIVDIDGTWTNKGEKAYLKANKIEFDDRGGEIQRPSGVVPVPPEDVQTAYNRPLVFVLQPDKNTMIGLEMSIGPLIGHHVFTKGGE